jgi:YtkA-like
MIEFRDRNDQLVDMGNVSFTINMNMPGMQMQGGGAAERTGTPGQYRAKVKTDMAGDWNARISYDGSRGKGQTNFSLNVKQ